MLKQSAASFFRAEDKGSRVTQNVYSDPLNYVAAYFISL
jgi:hypothetical protein